MVFRMLLVVFLLFISKTIVSSDEKSAQNCNKKENQKCTKEKSKKIGCCKLKYSGGGYDYLKATEDECKNNENYHMFLGYNNSLCMEWEEK